MMSYNANLPVLTLFNCIYFNRKTSIIVQLKCGFADSLNNDLYK